MHEKTLKHLAPRTGINHKTTKNKEQQRDHRLRTVSSINYRGVLKIFLTVDKLHPWSQCNFIIQKYINNSVRVMAQKKQQHNNQIYHYDKTKKKLLANQKSSASQS